MTFRAGYGSRASGTCKPVRASVINEHRLFLTASPSSILNTVPKCELDHVDMATGQRLQNSFHSLQKRGRNHGNQNHPGTRLADLRLDIEVDAHAGKIPHGRAGSGGASLRPALRESQHDITICAPFRTITPPQPRPLLRDFLPSPQRWLPAERLGAPLRGKMSRSS